MNYFGTAISEGMGSEIYSTRRSDNGWWFRRLLYTWLGVWVDPDGNEYVVVLNENDGKRNANLENVANDWNANYSFLSLPQRVYIHSWRE
ncbi:MAG: hypothetical protein WCT28_04165 [Patescibacteria group bacterium]|jgi:hypothetical protein